MSWLAEMIREQLDCLIISPERTMTEPRKIGRDDMTLPRELRDEIAKYVTCARKSMR